MYMLIMYIHGKCLDKVHWSSSAAETDVLTDSLMTRKHKNRESVTQTVWKQQATKTLGLWYLTANSNNKSSK